MQFQACLISTQIPYRNLMTPIQGHQFGPRERFGVGGSTESSRCRGHGGASYQLLAFQRLKCNHQRSSCWCYKSCMRLKIMHHNSRSYGSIVYTGSCGISIVNSLSPSLARSFRMTSLLFAFHTKSGSPTTWQSNCWLNGPARKKRKPLLLAAMTS